MSGRADTLERLRHLWALGSADLELLTRLVVALTREGFGQEALAVAREAVASRGLSGHEVARAVGAHTSETWQGAEGGRYEGRLCGFAPQTRGLREAWRWASHDPHDTYGKPLCTGYGLVAVQLQNTEVGMRFERLVVLDERTGRMLWQQERKALVASGALVWLEGSTGGAFGPSLGWPYALALDADTKDENEDQDQENPVALCLERFDLATGKTLGIARVEVQTSRGLEITPEMVAWGEDRFGWLLRWRQDETGDVAQFHRGTGQFLGMEPLPVAPRSVAHVGGEIFADDGTGLLKVEGARTEQITNKPLRRDFGGVALRFLAQGKGTQRIKARAEIWEKLKVLAAAPTGEMLVQADGRALLVVRESDTGWSEVREVELEEAEAHRGDRIFRAVWMGGDWLIVVGRKIMFGYAVVWCVDGETGAIRWCHRTTQASWSQGPIPSRGGVLGVNGEGVVFLTEM
jgi:outer membrane protein assembly factor BamB